MQLIAKYAYNTWAKGEINQKNAQNQDLIPQNTLIGYIVAGGDDYELGFTAPASARAQVQAAAQVAQTPVTRIGHIEARVGLRLLDPLGNTVQNHWTSFDHFS